MPPYAPRPMRLSYAILLPDDVDNFMRRVGADLFDRYGTSETTLLLEQHVTLKQPFEAERLAEHEGYLDRLAADLPPLELRMRDFGTFDYEGVVFLDVEPHARLHALQARIIADLGVVPAMFESGEPEPYRFHGTLAMGLTAAQLAEVRGTLGKTPDFRFLVARLGLFVETPAGWLLRRVPVPPRA